MADERSGLYREAILEHARHPKNQGRLEAPHLSAAASNPLCGDELELTMHLADGEIAAVNLMVRGCTIVHAAASMMSEAVSGMALDRARALGAEFRAAMEHSRAELPPGLEGLEPLTAVQQHRSRIRCALLPWDALESCGQPPPSA